MSIINFTPSTLSKEEKRAQDIANFKIRSNQLAAAIVAHMNAGADLFWRNPDFTPEEMAVAWGKDGGELFRLSSACGDFIEVITGQRPTIMPKGYIYTMLLDGSVVIGKLPDPDAP